MHRSIAALALGLGLIAGPAAQAQTGAGATDCIANGSVVLVAVTAQAVTPERRGETNMTEYAATLRATAPLRFVSVQLIAGRTMAVGIEAELPVGQDVRVSLGRRSGTRLTDSELRSGLRVICMPV